MINVEAACDPDCSNSVLWAPFRVGPWLCGCDWRMLLASRDSAPDWSWQEAPAGMVSMIAPWLDDAPTVAWREESTRGLSARMGRPLGPEPCARCGGAGGAFSDLRTYDACASCKGDGHRGPGNIVGAVQFGQWFFDCRRIAWLLAHVEAPSVRLRLAGEVMVMHWHDGAAVLMRCLPPDAPLVEVWT